MASGNQNRRSKDLVLRIYGGGGAFLFAEYDGKVLLALIFPYAAVYAAGDKAFRGADAAAYFINDHVITPQIKVSNS
jgi:hypothetical protein